MSRYHFSNHSTLVYIYSGTPLQRTPKSNVTLNNSQHEWNKMIFTIEKSLKEANLSTRVKIFFPMGGLCREVWILVLEIYGFHP